MLNPKQVFQSSKVAGASYCGPQPISQPPISSPRMRPPVLYLSTVKTRINQHLEDLGQLCSTMSISTNIGIEGNEKYNGAQSVSTMVSEIAFH